MPELHDLLERRAADYRPPPDLLERVHDRGRRRARTRKVSAALAGLLVTALIGGGLVRALTPDRSVVFDPPADTWAGTWVSIDSDGSNQTMDIGALDGVYEVVGTDDAATVCAGVSSTMTGTGRLDDGELIIPALVLECDDGSTPELVEGPPLAEQLRNYTLVYDTENDTLTDNFGVQWRRKSATPDVRTSEGAAASGFWPQSNIDEVRKAQELADSGDPTYSWQVDPALDEGNSRPSDAAIFTRFLTQELGWDGLRCCAESSREGMHWTGDGIRSVEVDFVRCAGEASNALYPDDPRSCAPTLDDRSYETLRVTAYQPLEAGPNGIWVIRRSEPRPAFRQDAPPSDTEIAEAVEPFLQARVDGKKASAHTVTDEATIPLLYATSDGAPYERFDHEVVEGPVWPYATLSLNVRLFADGGKTVVEQPFTLEGGVLEYAHWDRPTTENGTPVGEPYSLLGGQVSFSVVHQLGSWQGACCFTPSGVDLVSLQSFSGPATRPGGEYTKELVVVADPLPPAARCGVGDQPASPDELVRSLRSSRHLSVTAPKPARVGAIDAVRLDVTATDPPLKCTQGAIVNDGAPILAPRPDPSDNNTPQWYGVNPDNKARLYIFDVPAKPKRTVVVVVIGPKSGFDQVLEEVQPVLDSFEVTTR